ncbi:MAG TPA: tripartite tricarboxylate transporter substrate-binding protein [Burkholderiales bacterium]|nr:tripartite tricarboxylate transporter substrate-binding protein [Burkholderiales bacterium]
MLLLAAMPLAAACAAAQTYPAKPVRIITGGSGTFHDIVTRQLGQRLTERWGQPVVVENQGAAALTVGTGMAARATPDGYTLVMSDRSALAVAPHLYRSIPYHPVRDFSPITLAALTPTLLVAHPSVPAATLHEFLAFAKAEPREIHFATAGPGTNNHIAMELLKQAAGVNAAPIHYKGGGASTHAIVSGEVKMGFGALPSMLPHVKAGRVKAYAVTGSERFPGVPDIPTAAESGLRGFELEFWIGLLAPARTPPALVARLNHDITEVLRTPAMHTTLLTQGARAAPAAPGEFAAYIATESEKMKRLIDRTGMRAE